MSTTTPLNQLSFEGNDSTSHIGVTGFSVIDHRVRLKLNLSVIDYIILDAVAQITIVDNIKFTGLKKLRTIVGIDESELLVIVKDLIRRELLVPSEKYRYVPYLLFLSSLKYDEGFEYLWRMFKTKGSLGNKQTALKAYKGAIKVSPLKEIVVGANNYWASKAPDAEHKLHLSTFLNPDNKMWLDQYRKIQPTNQYKGAIDAE
jgi:hypothetical protein